MKCTILIEAAKSGYEKKYKCPYCELRLTRDKLPPHIDKQHQELIPEGYTALRVAFNTINHKDHGECIICKREAPWNEEKGRYERLCGRQECINAYRAMAKSRNKDVYGTENPQSDPRYKEEIQKKALANRKISGTYKFGDGGYVEYMGSYEKKLLEFMDKIMHVNSYDLLAPGPCIHYPFNGEDHLYISDFLYIPYNLIIEVKDGGDNPNRNQEMSETREKTKAKEAAVIADGKYNYIRLSNNDFSQLMEAFAVLKYQLLENMDQRYIKINESVLSESGIVEGMGNTIGAALAPNPAPAESNPDNYMMVQHLKNNQMAYGITKDTQCNEFISVDIDNGMMVTKMDKSKIDHTYTTFKMKDKRKAKEVYDEAVEMLKLGRKVDSTDYFYGKYTGKRVLTHDQIAFDEKFEIAPKFDDQMKLLNEQLLDYINNGKLVYVENMVKELGRITNGKE